MRFIVFQPKIKGSCVLFQRMKFAVLAKDPLNFNVLGRLSRSFQISSTKTKVDDHSGYYLGSDGSSSLPFDIKRDERRVPYPQLQDIGVQNQISSALSEESRERLELLQKNLREQLLARPEISHYDHLAPTASQLLKTTLAGHLPFIKSCLDMKIDDKGIFCLPPGHHLVYFNPQVTSDHLLPDGTDDLHSPGQPYDRRLWVGGSINFIRPMNLFPKKKMVCIEKITDVRVTGTPGKEKVFVDIYRQIVNSHLNRLELDEVRTQVFMKREKPVIILESRNAPKIRIDPDYSIVIRPTRTLLFRFSALTFNAHRIHLDSNYCRQVEGLKSMILHGPLTAVIMLTFLSEQLWQRARIDNFTYRNIAPLYVEEEMKICIKKGAKTGERANWRIWIEGPDGGCAVRGTANISWVGGKRNCESFSGDAMEENDLIPDESIFGEDDWEEQGERFNTQNRQS